MARDASALGHLGLMLGLLAIIVMLGALNYSVNPSGSGISAIFFPALVWVVGLVFVVGEWVEA